MPSCHTPLLGRDLLYKLGAPISLPPFECLGSLVALVGEGGLDDENLSLPTPWTAVNPVVWDISTPVVATHHTPVLICLKDPSHFPSEPQYPISQAHRRGLQRIVNCLLSQGLLVPTNSPCNTPILLVKILLEHITSFKTSE